jgi:hypothetical protein
MGKVMQRKTSTSSRGPQVTSIMPSKPHLIQDLRESIWKDNDWILTFSSYNTSGPLTPYSHKMRYKPFLGSMSPKSQNMRKHKGKKCGKW